MEAIDSGLRRQNQMCRRKFYCKADGLSYPVALMARTCKVVGEIAPDWELYRGHLRKFIVRYSSKSPLWGAAFKSFFTVIEGCTGYFKPKAAHQMLTFCFDWRQFLIWSMLVQ